MQRNDSAADTEHRQAAARALPAWLRASVPASALQLAMLFAALVAVPFSRGIDNDFWWHLRTGEFILHHGIPRHDPYSWTRAGQPWIAHEWLAEVFIYVAQSAIGYAATLLIFGFLTIGALMLVYSLGRRSGAGTKPLVVLMLLAVIVMSTFVTVRPQVFSWLMFAAFLYVLARHYDGERAPLWLLPPLMAVWVNLHLGFYFGLMLVGCWLAALCFDAVRGRKVALRTPFVVALACVFATFANPAGPAILAYPFRYLFDSQFANANVAEWQRPQLVDPSDAPIFIFALLLSLALISRTRPRAFLWLASLAVIVLSMQALRNAPYAVLVALPVVAGAASRRWDAARASRDSSLRVPLLAAAPLVIAIAAMLGPVAVLRAGVPLSIGAPTEVGYPAPEAAYVRAHHPGAGMYNGYSEGGYLIDALYPDVPVFVDGRTDFYGDDLLNDYLQIHKARVGWQALLDSYGVQVVLIGQKAELAAALSTDSGWQLEFTGPTAVVYARK